MRLILAVVFTVLSVFLFIYGTTGWGVMSILASLLFVLFHFRNEKNLLAFFFIRKKNLAKAGRILSIGIYLLFLRKGHDS